MLFRMIREIKDSSEWFGCVLVISFYAARVFLESVTYSYSCFASLLLITISASYAVNDIGGGTHKVISDLNRSLGSRYFLYVMNERTSFSS